jgi:hypothetical protein
MTTFGGRSLDTKFAAKGYSSHHCLQLSKNNVPLPGAPKHIMFKAGDKRYATLEFEEPGPVGSSPGYVKLDTLYKMDWRDLQRFGRNVKTILCQESTGRLLTLLKDVSGYDPATK